MRLATSLTLGLVLLTPVAADAAIYTWKGDVSSNFNTATNWRLPSGDVSTLVPASGDTAQFGANPASTSVTLSANRDGVTIEFLAGAPSYSISGRRVGNVVRVDAAVTNPQQLTSALRASGGVTVRNDSQAQLTLGGIDNSSASQATLYTSEITATGDVAFTGAVQASGRIVRTVKTGGGTLAYTSSYDFKISDTTVATIDVQEGTLDTSNMTLVLEALNTDAAPTLTLSSYVIVDYSGATLDTFTASQVFGAVTNLPSGYQVVNDTASQQVRLQLVPEPATATLLAAGGLLIARSRRS